MIPYIEESREDYVERCRQNHLEAAKLYPPHAERSMWLQLFYYAMAEEIYGDHWDRLQEK